MNAIFRWGKGILSVCEGLIQFPYYRSQIEIRVTKPGYKEKLSLTKVTKQLQTKAAHVAELADALDSGSSE